MLAKIIADIFNDPITPDLLTDRMIELLLQPLGFEPLALGFINLSLYDNVICLSLIFQP